MKHITHLQISLVALGRVQSGYVQSIHLKYVDLLQVEQSQFFLQSNWFTWRHEHMPIWVTTTGNQGYCYKCVEYLVGQREDGHLVCGTCGDIVYPVSDSEWNENVPSSKVLGTAGTGNDVGI